MLNIVQRMALSRSLQEAYFSDGSLAKQNQLHAAAGLGGRGCS